MENLGRAEYGRQLNGRSSGKLCPTVRVFRECDEATVVENAGQSVGSGTKPNQKVGMERRSEGSGKGFDDEKGDQKRREKKNWGGRVTRGDEETAEGA